jgi:hypothetical protein
MSGYGARRSIYIWTDSFQGESGSWPGSPCLPTALPEFDDRHQEANSFMPLSTPLTMVRASLREAFFLLGSGFAHYWIMF